MDELRHQRLAWGADRRVLQLDGVPGVPRRVQSQLPSPEQLAALAPDELSLELDHAHSVFLLTPDGRFNDIEAVLPIPR